MVSINISLLKVDTLQILMEEVVYGGKCEMNLVVLSAVNALSCFHLNIKSCIVIVIVIVIC